MTLIISGKTVGENIRLAREHAGISQKELAQELLVSDVMMNYYEQDKKPINDLKLAKVAEICKVTVAELKEIAEPGG